MLNNHKLKIFVTDHTDQWCETRPLPLGWDGMLLKGPLRLVYAYKKDSDQSVLLNMSFPQILLTTMWPAALFHRDGGGGGGTEKIWHTFTMSFMGQLILVWILHFLRRQRGHAHIQKWPVTDKQRGHEAAVDQYRGLIRKQLISSAVNEVK